MTSKHTSKNRHTKPKKKLTTTPEYEVAFLLFDLSSKSIKAKVLRITELLLSKDGETDFNQYLFSIGDAEISKEASEYHGIHKEDLIGKPELKSYDFFKARNIVVWDGHTTTSILKANEIRRTSPITNLLSLARFKEENPKTISLKKYAIIAQPQKRHTLDFTLQKPENKVLCLPAIYNFLQKEYLELHGLDDPLFLYTVGRSRDKETYNAIIKKAINKHSEFMAKNEAKIKSSKKPSSEVSIAIGDHQIKQGVTAVTVLKRKKS